MSKPLEKEEITLALSSLPGWTYTNRSLSKTYTFSGFKEALSFMVRAGFEAEGMNHHPDWTNVYNKVEIRLNTHDAGGKVTALDVELAKRIQRISWTG